MTYPQGRCEEALVSLDEAIVKLERTRAEDELAFLMYARMYPGLSPETTSAARRRRSRRRRA